MKQSWSICPEWMTSRQAKLSQSLEPMKVTTKHRKTLTKQDVHIVYATGSTRLVLWEYEVGSLELDKSYSFTNVGARQYSEEKFLSSGKSSTKSLVDDIGDVTEDAETTNSCSGTIDGEIYSDISSATFHKCNSKVDIVDDKLDKCTKCKALSKFLVRLRSHLWTGAHSNSWTSQEDMECRMLMTPSHKFRITVRDVLELITCDINWHNLTDEVTAQY